MSAQSPTMAKVRWLLAHGAAWQDLPFESMPELPRKTRCQVEALPPEMRVLVRRWHLIVAGMRREGLVSRNTYAGDVQVPWLIQLAKKYEERSRRRASHCRLH